MGDDQAGARGFDPRDVYHALSQREQAEISSRCAALAADIFRRIPSYIEEAGRPFRDRASGEGKLHAAADDLSAAALTERRGRELYTKWVFGGWRRYPNGDV